MKQVFEVISNIFVLYRESVLIKKFFVKIQYNTTVTILIFSDM